MRTVVTAERGANHDHGRQCQVWRPGYWRTLPARQQPGWADSPQLTAATTWLATRHGLVTDLEVLQLRGMLAQVARGRAFVFQAGDCAETFDPVNRAALTQRVGIMNQASAIIKAALGVPVILVGRIAGQYAKPRSSLTETYGDSEISVFRGYLINGPEQNAAARVHTPGRMVQAYQHAAQTMRALRELAPQDKASDYHRVALWTSHEALVLDYEQHLLRRSGAEGQWFLSSTHLPWIGMRTCSPDEAHVGFLAGTANPVGCKIGPAATPDLIGELCRRLDPGREPGRLIFIARMGAEMVAERLPPLVKAVARLRHPVIWMCDPMHGNTFVTPTGHKSRQLATILAELRIFFEVMHMAGGWPGGVHLETAAGDVTECVGGSDGPSLSNLPQRYETACDPRLNPAQTIEVAVRVADYGHP